MIWTSIRDCIIYEVTSGDRGLSYKTCFKRPLQNRQNKGLKDKW